MPAMMTTSHETQIDLSLKQRTPVIESLNLLLAHGLDLKTQVKVAHWNVKGPQFMALHELFDTMAAELEDYNDMMAERITTLAGTAYGSIRDAVEHSTLPAYPYEIFEGQAVVRVLAQRYAQFGKLLRDSIPYTEGHHDADTVDLFTEVSRSIDKRLWFLEAHLQG